MYGTKLVLLSVLACTIGACHSAAVGETEVQRMMRLLGGMTRYYVQTASQEIEVKNDEDEIEALTILTGGTQRVAILIHGRDSSPHSGFTNRVTTAFLNHNSEMAVITVDWEVVSKLSYTIAASAVRDVGADLSTFIATLDDKGKLNLDLLHIVGFDLGAHVAGYASRQAASRAKVITGLDPAGQGWDQFSARLRSSDADLVEVIHTDGVGNRAFGIGEHIGDLDFFPNGGTRQPGCAASNNQCHHDRSWELFAATLDQPGQLVGLRCEDLAQVNSNRCTGWPATMGTAVLEKRETGIYRLPTGRVWPFTV